MPHSKSRAARETKRVRAQVPRDKRKLSRWAVQGTHDDYEKLRRHARRLSETAPSYVSQGAVDLLSNADRVSMIQAAHEKDNHWLTDGLAWMLDKIPGKDFLWLPKLGQAALKPFRGDSMNEVDEQYARLIGQGYKDNEDRVDDFEHWQRQAEFDTDYLTVWDNEDGHRFVSVRGTKANTRDLGEDAWIGVAGRPRNLVGEDLKRVLDNTKPGQHVDVGGHSLGTSLILTAYDNDENLQDRVHNTHLYNPAYSPLPTARNVTADFEHDERVRYFIDLTDPVSVGGLGSKGPKNVVYRNNFGAIGNPLSSHYLTQWGGDEALNSHDEDAAQTKQKDPLPYDRTGDGVPNLPEPAGEPTESVANDDEFLLDFGDDYDGSSWNVYWNK